MRAIAVAALLLLGAWPVSLNAHELGSSGANTPGSSASLAAKERQFAQANLAGKLSLVSSLSDHPLATEGPLFEKALDYLFAHPPLLSGTAQGAKLALETTRLVGRVAYAPAAAAVWRLFQIEGSPQVRLAALDALAVVARGKGRIVGEMDHWLASRNLLHSDGSTVDTVLVDGCVRALAALASPRSFPVLFATAQEGYGAQITNDARNGLRLVKGDRTKLYLELLSKVPIAERASVLELAVKEKGAGPFEQATVASAALKGALEAKSDQAAALELRFMALAVLSRLAWTPATALVVESFNRSVREFARDEITKKDFITAIDALSSMGSHEAAVRLSLYLGLINSEVEKGRSFDTSVVLAVVRGLGRLGDPIAYGTLLAIEHLDYPSSVGAAAAKAVSNLGT